MIFIAGNVDIIGLGVFDIETGVGYSQRFSEVRYNCDIEKQSKNLIWATNGLFSLCASSFCITIVSAMAAWTWLGEAKNFHFRLQSSFSDYF